MTIVRTNLHGINSNSVPTFFLLLCTAANYKDHFMTRAMVTSLSARSPGFISRLGSL